jgi:acetylornithine deacetylase
MQRAHPQPSAGPPELAAALDDLWPKYQSLLAGLIQIPSVSGQESEAQRYLAAAASDAGLNVELWDVDPGPLSAHADFAESDGCALPRPNVTAILPGTGGAKSIAISGHVDVVPAGPEHRWSHDPFSADIEDGRMFGRGALDMKGGLVAGLLAVHALRAVYGALPGDVVFESVLEEECTGNGTLAARLHGPAVDAALIPEITQEDVQIANPGVVWFEVKVTGKSAYVGLAGASVNAIDMAMDLISALRSLPDELNRQFEHPAYAAYERPLTLNVGTIHAGEWPSNVPLECVVGFRLAFPLDWSVERAQALVTDRIASFAAGHPWLASNVPTVRWHGFLARGFAIAEDAPLVALLRSVITDVTGAPARISPMFGTADARYFADQKIPAVYYGPAGGGMHSPDEWVDLASVRRVAAVLANTILRWCS